MTYTTTMMRAVDLGRVSVRSQPLALERGKEQLHREFMISIRRCGYNITLETIGRSLPEPISAARLLCVRSSDLLAAFSFGSSYSQSVAAPAMVCAVD